MERIKEDCSRGVLCVSTFIKSVKLCVSKILNVHVKGCGFWGLESILFLIYNLNGKRATHAHMLMLEKEEKGAKNFPLGIGLRRLSSSWNVHRTLFVALAMVVLVIVVIVLVWYSCGYFCCYITVHYAVLFVVCAWKREAQLNLLFVLPWRLVLL